MAAKIVAKTTCSSFYAANGQACKTLIFIFSRENDCHSGIKVLTLKPTYKLQSVGHSLINLEFVWRLKRPQNVSSGLLFSIYTNAMVLLPFQLFMG